jgi:hypothetical protein
MPTDQPTPAPDHLGLGELIARLAAEPDQDRRVPVGFHEPHSYRGDYWDLAFEVAHDVTVGEMLAAARSALGATFQGWKGGDFTMGKHTSVWLVTEAGDCGESLGAVLLSLLLTPPADVDAAYERGKAEGQAELERLRAMRLNRPMLDRLRRCATDTSPNWDGACTIYPPDARGLVALIDALSGGSDAA